MDHSFDMVPAPSKAEQIMARYRPIAPKPQVPQPHNGDTPPITDKKNFLPCIIGLPPASAQSLLIGKPRRGRKRRSGILASPKTKKAKIQLLGASSLPTITTLDLTLQGFHHNVAGFAFGNLGFISKLKSPTTSTAPNFFNHSLLPFPSSIVPLHESVQASFTNMVSPNQNLKFEHAVADKDLLQKLQAPSSPEGWSQGQVIAPQPVRPVGSTISVKSICESEAEASSVPACKRPEEVEEEMESETLPAVLSDSNNRVRLANSAYKELVGQPECSWLDSMVAGHGKQTPAAKRISGEVMLLLADCPLPNSSNAFSCRVEIEWKNNGQKGSTAAACDVAKLSCESKDYLFTWRFHLTSEACDARCK